MHSIIWVEILQRWYWMQIKTFLKIWLLSVNCEKLNFINRPYGSVKSVRPVYTDEFLKVNGQEPNFQEWFCWHSLSRLENFSLNYWVHIYALYIWTLYNTITLCWHQRDWMQTKCTKRLDNYKLYIHKYEQHLIIQQHALSSWWCKIMLLSIINNKPYIDQYRLCNW